MSSSYCINPRCPKPKNTNDLYHCQACKSSLVYMSNESSYRAINLLDDQTQGILNNQKDIRLYEVVDEEKGTIKVLKVLINNSIKLIELVEKEAETLHTLKKINHLGIPKFYSFFTFLTSDGIKLHCLLMDKIEGQNLQQWLHAKGKISQDIALKWLSELVDILDLVHENGFMHQDIKPSNIMRRKHDEKLVLINFSDVPDIVSSGYTPSEQLKHNANFPSDFFALGRTFVHLLTGLHPSSLPNSPETSRLIWRDKALQVSQSLADLIDNLMAPLPSARPQDAKVIRKRLEQITNPLPPEPAVGERENPSYLPEQENFKQKNWVNRNIRRIPFEALAFFGFGLLFLGTFIGEQRGRFTGEQRIPTPYNEDVLTVSSDRNVLTIPEKETERMKCIDQRSERFKQLGITENLSKKYSPGRLMHDDTMPTNVEAWKWVCRYYSPGAGAVQMTLNFDDVCREKHKNEKLTAVAIYPDSKEFNVGCYVNN